MLWTCPTLVQVKCWYTRCGAHPQADGLREVNGKRYGVQPQSDGHRQVLGQRYGVNVQADGKNQTRICTRTKSQVPLHCTALHCTALEESFITVKKYHIFSVLQQIVKTYLLVWANSIKHTRLSLVCPASVHNTFSNLLSSEMWLSKHFLSRLFSWSFQKGYIWHLLFVSCLKAQKSFCQNIPHKLEKGWCIRLYLLDLNIHPVLEGVYLGAVLGD